MRSGRLLLRNSETVRTGARRRPTYVRVAAFFGLVAVCTTGCASDYQQVLKQVSPLPILNRVPPGGVELGRAEDNGTIAGDQPGVAVVYASDRSAAELDRYYLSHYRTYSLKHDDSVDYGGTRPSFAEIGSFSVGNVDATVVIRIQRNAPDLTEQGINYDLKLKPPPMGATTFVTVNVIGFVPKSESR